MSDRAEPRAAGVLYVIATPIGNLGDLSPRALGILRTVDLIACEDTRRTGKLLAAHSLRTPMVSYFEHNEQRRTPELIERLSGGQAVAIVTDAGTPGISDPGYRLVCAAHEAGIRVAAVPGPSAPIAALSISGLPTDRFTFEGFLPQRASTRRRLLGELRNERRTMIFFEAARRLPESLAALAEMFGADRGAAVVREITKTFEETARGKLGELCARFAAAVPRGEITLVVAGAPQTSSSKADDAEVEGAAFSGALTVEALRGAGVSLKQASTVIAKLTGASRREVYQRTLKKRGRCD